MAFLHLQMPAKKSQLAKVNIATKPKHTWSWIYWIRNFNCDNKSSSINYPTRRITLLGVKLHYNYRILLRSLVKETVTKKPHVGQIQESFIIWKVWNVSLSLWKSFQFILIPWERSPGFQTHRAESCSYYLTSRLLRSFRAKMLKNKGDRKKVQVASLILSMCWIVYGNSVAGSKLPRAGSHSRYDTRLLQNFRDFSIA